jgi:hypothetical protein
LLLVLKLFLENTEKNTDQYYHRNFPSFNLIQGKQLLTQLDKDKHKGAHFLVGQMLQG